MLATSRRRAQGVFSLPRALPIVVFLLVALVGARPAAAQDVAPVDTSVRLALEPLPYKAGSYFPLTLMNGVDFLEPFLPVEAARQGDVGRIVLGSALPYALLVSAFAAAPWDIPTYMEIKRWKWVGVDDFDDNYPILFGLVAIGGLSALLPAPAEDAGGYSWQLRLDRLAVFGLAEGLANLEVEILKPVFDRTRPDGDKGSSRPSGHAATAFAAMAFASDTLRDWIRPEEEPELGLRIVEETATALPYLGAFYMALERVQHSKHFLSDTLLGGALGIFSTQMLYDWSFLRTELGGGWFEGFEISYEPGGFMLAWKKTF
jgi:membrane-associated phospholipid phosphatase